MSWSAPSTSMLPVKSGGDDHVPRSRIAIDVDVFDVQNFTGQVPANLPGVRGDGADGFAESQLDFELSRSLLLIVLLSLPAARLNDLCPASKSISHGPFDLPAVCDRIRRAAESDSVRITAGVHQLLVSAYVMASAIIQPVRIRFGKVKNPR